MERSAECTQVHKRWLQSHVAFPMVIDLGKGSFLVIIVFFLHTSL